MKRLILLIACAAPLAAAHAQPSEKYERKGPGEWTYEAKDGRREVKRESKPDEYKEEVKTRYGESKYEEKADGSWKEEIKRGNCVVKRERTADGQYKEEESC